MVVNSFGTDDTEWFCATETILNVLFSLKTRNSPEYAKLFIHSLTKKLYQGDVKRNSMDAMITLEDEVEVQEEAGTPLRADVTDMHYA